MVWWQPWSVDSQVRNIKLILQDERFKNAAPKFKSDMKTELKNLGELFRSRHWRRDSSLNIRLVIFHPSFRFLSLVFLSGNPDDGWREECWKGEEEERNWWEEEEKGMIRSNFQLDIAGQWTTCDISLLYKHFLVGCWIICKSVEFIYLKLWTNYRTLLISP